MIYNASVVKIKLKIIFPTVKTLQLTATLALML
jgi:hypothetical protein